MPASSPNVTLLHEWFSCFLNSTDWTKSRKTSHQNLLSIRENWKIVGINFLEKLKIDGNKVVKKCLVVALWLWGSWILSIKRGHKAFFFLNNTVNKTHSRINLKNDSDLGDIYILFIYRSISFYRQHLKITCKLCTPVRLEVGGLSHGTLPPLTLKSSLNTNVVNVFNPTRVTCRSSLTNLWYMPLQFQFSITNFCSWS